jgi:Protein of unknown function (DUF3037)
VSERVAYEYALIRVTPRIDRGECINAGVMLVCRARRFLGARVALDHSRLFGLMPDIDPDIVQGIERQLEFTVKLCEGDPAAGPLALLSLPERWHLLTAPASTIVGPGPAHTGRCHDPAACLEHLFATLAQ